MTTARRPPLSSVGADTGREEKSSNAVEEEEETNTFLQRDKKLQGHCLWQLRWNVENLRQYCVMFATKLQLQEWQESTWLLTYILQVQKEKLSTAATLSTLLATAHQNIFIVTSSDSHIMHSTHLSLKHFVKEEVFFSCLWKSEKKWVWRNMTTRKCHDKTIKKWDVDRERRRETRVREKRRDQILNVWVIIYFMVNGKHAR